MPSKSFVCPCKRMIRDTTDVIKKFIKDNCMFNTLSQLNTNSFRISDVTLMTHSMFLFSLTCPCKRKGIIRDTCSTNKFIHDTWMQNTLSQLDEIGLIIWTLPYWKLWYDFVCFCKWTTILYGWLTKSCKILSRYIDCPNFVVIYKYFGFYLFDTFELYMDRYTDIQRKLLQLGQCLNKSQ